MGFVHSLYTPVPVFTHCNRIETEIVASTTNGKRPCSMERNQTANEPKQNRQKEVQERALYSS